MILTTNQWVVNVIYLHCANKLPNTFDFPLPEENTTETIQSITSPNNRNNIDRSLKNSGNTWIEYIQKDSLLYGKGKNEYGSHTFGYYHPQKDSLILNEDGTGLTRIPKKSTIGN